MLQDGLCKNYIARSMKDPPENLLETELGENYKEKWNEIKRELRSRYSIWHKQKQNIIFVNSKKQKQDKFVRDL